MIDKILWPVISLGGMGLIFGAGLAFAYKKFGVATDPKVDAVREVLPGANCGGCGYAGCDGFAAAVASGKAAPDGCPVGGAPVAEKVADILGVDGILVQPKVAKVLCQGDCERAISKYNYSGIGDCVAAAMLSEGPKGCRYGCMGLGSCVKACPFDAIHVNEKGIAFVDEEKCTACGKCVAACPKGIIKLVPKESNVHVLCISRDKGKDVRTNCSIGCIGCRLCVKECKYDAIKVENNIASIDYNKCTNCQACAKKCPTGAIKSQLQENDPDINEAETASGK